MRSAFFQILVLILLPIILDAQAVTAQKKKTSPSTQQLSKSSKLVSKPESLLSKQEQEILAEINLARSNPSQYIRYLEEFKRRYNGKELKFSNGQSLITNEGVEALDDAIEFLRSAKPSLPLETRKGLVFGARDHMKDMVQTGVSGHKGSDGTRTEDRLHRYGSWSDSVGENIVYYSRSPREDVISLIIDDGVLTRGHRKNIFKSDFHVIGIALSPPQKSGTICVITFAGGFIDKAATSQKGTAPEARKF